MICIQSPQVHSITNSIFTFVVLPSAWMHAHSIANTFVHIDLFAMDVCV